MRRAVNSLLALVISCSSANAVVAFDTTATTFSGSAATSFTDTSHTIGAISNGALIVFLEFSAVVTSVVVKWDNTGTPQTMTQIGTKTATDSKSEVFLFGLIAPHTGNHTLAVSWTGSADYAGISASYSGADQSSPATTFINVVTDASNTSNLAGDYPTGDLSITTASGDMAVMAAGTGLGVVNAGGGLGTQIGNINNANISGDDRYLAAAGSTTVVAAQASGAQPACAVGADIAKVSAGGATPNNRALLGVGK